MLYTVSKRALILAFAIFIPLVFTVRDNVIYGQGSPIVFRAGAEVVAGSVDQNTSTVYGSTITLNSLDSSGTQHLTVSFDYVTTDPASFPIISGSWTLVMIRDGRYAGTIYGSVTSGKVKPTGTFAPPNEPPSGPRDLSIELETVGTIEGGDIVGPFNKAHVEVTSDGHNLSGSLTPAL